MRFMMLIPKGYEKAAPGAMPDAKAVEGMMKYNEALQKAGVLLAIDGLHPPSMGARVVPGRQTQGQRGAVHRGEGGNRRLLDDSGEVEGRGDRMGFAMPRFGKRSDRDSSSAGDVGLSSRPPGSCVQDSRATEEAACEEREALTP